MDTPPFEQLGGEIVVRRIVDAFYDHMDTCASAQTIREMHPEDLTESREKFFWFLVGWLGGPPLYVERRGHPRLRRRHFPFAVDRDAAIAWMHCMDHALDAEVTDAALRTWLSQALERVAIHMINR